MSDLNNTQNEKLVFRKPPDAPQGMKSNQTKVSFIESKTDAIPVRNIRNSETLQNASQPDNDRPEESGSKIRRMSDSTRAKEAEKSRKNLRKGKNSYAQSSSEKNYTYQKERPDGDYSDDPAHDPAQNLDPRKSRKRRKFSRQNDVTALASETLHLDLRDIVPVAVQKPEPVRPVDVKPAPRAAQTSLNLSTSSQGTATADDLDVTIRKTPEEAEKENMQRQKTSAMMQMENVEEIKSDIKELRNAIFFRTMALMLVALISGYLSVRSCFHLPWLDSIPENLIALMQLLLGLAAGSVCMPTLRNGFTRLIQLRADTDSLSAIALGACLLDAFFGIFGVSSPLIAHYFMPCAVLILIFHTMGKLLIIDREERNLNEIDKCYDYYGLQIIEDEQKAESLARGILHDFPIVAAMRKTEYLKEFRRYTYSADIADHFCHYAAPAIFAFSLVASIAMAIFRQGGISYAVSLFSMFSIACGCAAITFVTSLPLFKATKDLTKSRALLLGYQSIDDFYDTNSLMLDAAAMFPVGSIQLQGVKMFSNVRSDEILLAAASLARYAGSAFRHIFDEVLHERSGDFYPVENYIYEDSLGLCGWIHNQRVLLGNRELMISHRIEGVPSKSKESEMTGENKEVIYLSISGNLSALFVVELHADKIVKSWVRQAIRHNMCLILHSVDPMITLYRISSLFEIPQDMVKIIPAKMRNIYLTETTPLSKMSTSLACTNDFSNMAQLIIATKSIRKLCMTGVFVQAVTVLLGLAFVLMEALLHLGINSGWMIILQCITVILTLVCVYPRKLY